MIEVSQVGALSTGDLQGNGGGIEVLADITFPNNIILNTNLVINTPNNQATLNGAISGAGNLVKMGNDTLIIGSGGNTYTGNTIVDAGTLSVSQTNALGAGGNINLSSGTTLAMTTNALTLPNNISFTTNAFFTVTDQRAILTGSITGGTLSDTLNVSTSAGGILQITGPCNLLTFLLNEGIVEITTSTALEGVPVTTAVGTLLDVSTSVAAFFSNPLIVNGSFQLGAGEDCEIAGDGSQFNGPLISPGNAFITLNDAILLVSGDSPAFLGQFAVHNGTLRLTGSLNPAAKVGMNAGTFFDMSGISNSQELAFLQGAGGLATLGSKTLILPASGGLCDVNFAATPGNLTQVGAGTLHVTGHAAYTGTTTVNGTFALMNNGQLSPVGTVQVNAAPATFSIGLITPASTTIGNLQGSGLVSLGTKTLFLGTTDSSTFSGVIMDGGSIHKQSSGTLTLSGANTFTGGTTISGGALQLTGSLASGVVVQSGGTLSGGGTLLLPASITGDVTVYGLVAPSTTTSVFDVIGTYTQKSGSALAMQFVPNDPPLIAITGNAVIESGTTFEFLPQPGHYISGTTYIIMTATGTLTGEFSRITSPYPLFELSFIAPGELLLTIAPFTSVISTGNAGHVAAYLDTLNPVDGSDLSYIFDQLDFLTAPQLEKALNQMQPAIYKGMTFLAQESDFQMTRLIGNHLAEFYVTPCQKDAAHRRQFHVWAAGYTDWIDQPTRNDLVGLQSQIEGGMVGVDCTTTDYSTIGLGFGYTHANVSWLENAGAGTIKTYYGSVYGNYTRDLFFANALILGSFGQFYGYRNIDFGVIQRTAFQHHRGAGFTGHLDSGLLLDIASHLEIRPFAAADYIYSGEDAFIESGAYSLDLGVQKAHASMLRGEMGLNGSSCINLQKGKFILDGKVSWVREWRFFGALYNSYFDTEPGFFTVSGLYPCQSLVACGANLTYLGWNDHIAFNVGYQGQFGRGYTENMALGKISYRF